MKTMRVTWSLILCGALLAGAWHAFKVLSGKYDLIIDETTGSMELPATQGRKSRRRVPLSEVQGVYVETVQKPSRGDEQSSPMYAPTLRLASPASERLA